MRYALAPFAVIACMVACVVAPPPKPTPPADDGRRQPPSGYELAAFEGGIIEAVNDERSAARLARLTVDSRLAQAARVHASNMARLQRLSHTLPGATTSTLVSRVTDVGYSYSALAENIAYGPVAVEPLVDGWMRSPGHRENILNPAYTETGVGVARSRDGVLFYCQVFGRPR